ncbi:MAG: PTS sugar transporter subunit IIA [Gloeobacteraceae cyanobacterium ES-bin-144]|nr:PTS sugar transporter subunit IIA [Verrucomicrobiales bacterium]
MNPSTQPNSPVTEDELTLGELAAYLGWSTRFIEGLVRGERLPANEAKGQLRFVRRQVIDWLEQKIQSLDHADVSKLENNLESSLLADGTFRTLRTDRLTSRLPETGIAIDLPLGTKPEILAALANLAANTGLLKEQERLLQSLTDRELLFSTAVPGGIALCHPQRPIPHLIDKQFLCFLSIEKPIDFGAEDGKGTSLFFLLCAPDDRSHLHGLARLARLLQPDVLNALRAAETAPAVLSALAQAEAAIQHLPHN